MPPSSEHSVLGATVSVSRSTTLHSAPASAASAASPVASTKALAGT